MDPNRTNSFFIGLGWFGFHGKNALTPPNPIRKIFIGSSNRFGQNRTNPTHVHLYFERI